MATDIEQVQMHRLRAEANLLEINTSNMSRSDLIIALKGVGLYKIDLRWPAPPKPINVTERSKDPSNIFIGNGAGLKEQGNNKLYIANSSTETSLIGGDFSKNKVSIYNVLKLEQSDVSPQIKGEEGDIRRLQSTLYMYRSTDVHPGWYPIQFGSLVII